MKHLLDIFKQRNIIRAYAECRNGSQQHLLTSFQLELDSILDKVAAEINTDRTVDKHLYRIGLELLEIVIAVARAVPLEGALLPPNNKDIHDKIDDAFVKTKDILKNSSPKDANKGGS